MRRGFLVTLCGLSLLLTGVGNAKDTAPVVTEQATVQTLIERLDMVEKKLRQMEGELAQRPRGVNQYRLPKSVKFCGKAVDLTREDIRSRVYRELMLVLGNRAQVGLWHARVRRAFPVIERHAKTIGACDDLKYVAVIESGLRASVTSRASAKGWWQFMGPTGRQYGLKTYQSWDERADLDKATRAGLTYLKTLNESFGSYPLALAAYNTGPGRLRREIKRQGVSDFWRLDLYREAERYVPRTIAIKMVLSAPEDFDFYFDQRPVKTSEVGYVKTRLPNNLDLGVLKLARGTGVDYRALRELNPEIGADLLPRGIEFVLTVPAGKEPALRKYLGDAVEQHRTHAASRKRGKSKKARSRAKANRKVSRSGKRKARKKEKAKRRYRIKRGDSLWSIASRHSVSVGELRRWNRLKQRSVLKAGQKLIVRKGG
jgi:membrane-bound lytic murein transglycosylase D